MARTRPPLAAGVTLPQSTTLTLFALVAMYTCAMSATWPLVVVLCEQLGITGAMQGLVYALAGAGQVLSGVFAGHACIKYGKRAVLNLSLAALSMAWVAVAVHPTFWTLALAQVLTGFAAGTMVSASAYFGAHSAPQSRTKAFAWMLAFCGVGQVGGPAVFNLGIAQNPQTVCYLVLGLSLTALLFSYFCLQDSVQAPVEGTPATAKCETWLVLKSAKLQLAAYGLLL